MKNEELGGFATYAPAGVPDCFMMGRKTFGFTCECRGLQGEAEAIPILHS